MAEKTLAERIGMRLRAAREARGVSLAAMRDHGFHSGHVLRIEQGQFDVRLSTLCKLAKALGVKPDSLLNGL
jgi:transcriptional regulator with XRE-family HTH domain